MLDAHQHFWDPARAQYPWMTEEVAAIRRPFGPDELRPHVTAAGIDRTILVQTRASIAETREFLALAATTDFIAGVVGWVDLTSSAVAEEIASLRAQPGGEFLVAIRHQVHDEPDPQWLTRADVRRGLAAVRDAGLSYDLLIRERELAAANAVVQRFPDLPFVLDHCAKPPIAGGTVPASWADGISKLAAEPNVWCKLSGLVTEANWSTWTTADIRPYVAHVFAAFGPARLVYGSDWPVCLLAASYERVVRSAHTLVAELSRDTAHHAAIFGGNAISAYRLPVRSVESPASQG